MQLNIFNVKSNTTCHTVHYCTTWVVNSNQTKVHVDTSANLYAICKHTPMVISMIMMHKTITQQPYD